MNTETASTSSQKTQITRETMNRKRFLDFVLILSEITQIDHHVLTKKYEKYLRADEILGIVLAEIRVRRSRGDSLRQEIKKLKHRIEELSQLELPFSRLN